ncbi:hypothetical protein GGX14DRAFT_654585 [Mycena pura]|uniref:F-box domain-containing protein n=1 Tax=Mycena pura TaxID=153505 RepID=A0AAD6YAB2_9AGAR|nr:hypothetical protein GGX14DRAFT_654585 [Mycena pura]
MTSLLQPVGWIDLPNELMLDVLSRIEVWDLLVLCPTSRQIYAHCMTRIYRSITLEDIVQLIKCFKAIILHTEAAEAVHNLQILCSPSCPLKSFYAIVHRAIQRLKNLRTLKVHTSCTIFHLFYDMHFPHLSALELEVTPWDDVISFLKHNPMLSTLRIFPIDSISLIIEQSDVGLAPTAPMPPIQMPKLQTFFGPTLLASAIVPGSLTSDISIVWEGSRSTSFSDCLATLVLSKAEIVAVNNYVCTWDCSSLLLAIAHHIPQVQRLQFVNISGSWQQYELFLASVEDSLPSFECLGQLELHSLIPPNAQLFNDDLDAGFRLASRWGEICPSLEIVCFPDDVPWARFHDWIPEAAVEALNHDIGRITIDETTMRQLKWFFAKTLTPASPPSYLGFARYLLGEDGLIAMENAIANLGDLPNFELERGSPMDVLRITFLAQTLT